MVPKDEPILEDQVDMQPRGHFVKPTNLVPYDEEQACREAVERGPYPATVTGAAAFTMIKANRSPDVAQTPHHQDFKWLCEREPGTDQKWFRPLTADGREDYLRGIRPYRSFQSCTRRRLG